MRTLDQLAHTLAQLDGRGYPSYKQVSGPWGDADLMLALDHVQGDPFATPSRLRVRLSPAIHELPRELYATATRRMALCDFLLRRFAGAVSGATDRHGSGKSGEIWVDAGDAEILLRSGCAFVGDDLELRLRVGLPAQGRRILGRRAARLLTDELPAAARRVAWSHVDQAAAQRFVELAEDHAYVQSLLPERGLVAFVRDGALLPRASGVSSRPLRNAVPFESPPSLRVTLPTLHHGDVTGMGLPVGVTLITGGGFHGKTTLLEAICHGIDPHVPGDGREWVVTSPDAVELRSEDGRSVVGVDLRPFIADLPGDHGTERFSTPDASGSTSLAASIMEALELGATALLLDEDGCATNLLIRDARMQALVARETITPLIDRVRQLHGQAGVSTVLVVGGSGDYLEVADTVILMQDYRPLEVTARAREVAAAHPTGRAVLPPRGEIVPTPRHPRLRSFDPRRGQRTKVRARGLRELQLGEQTIDLGALEQLCDDSQARGIGALLSWLHAHGRAGASLRALVDQALEAAQEHGLYAIDPLPELAGVRRHELAAAINRLRSLELE
ncbi:ABC-ATPase domain-containing protein [Paraliomyxa miuraensis]|uniref:ABC-ATPase domain-containing protein n=1 Tax=Paraliomyxa miuraensis TaxID=376150 RepID=UPI002256A46C|nr:ABC-ATPase domain-containing protein [Paraliomyxa miuraensis]MCX4244342.1 ABC-ATPase domain-containing protein [Paraliomyxa miuraensis]